MQRNMRAKSACEKRHQLFLRHQEQRKGLLGHADCDVPGGKLFHSNVEHYGNTIPGMYLVIFA